MKTAQSIIRLVIWFSLLGACLSTAHCQTAFDASSQIVERLPNDTVTGTTVNQLAKVNASGKLINITTVDTVIPVYLVIGNAGISGNASLASSGTAQCKFDAAGGTTGHFVQASTSVAGTCRDAGTTLPISGWTIGQLLTSPAANALGTVLLTKGEGLLPTLVYNNQANIFGTGFLQTFDTIQLNKFNASSWFDVSGFAGATEDLKFIACTAALPSTGGVCDGTKLTGPQSIASDAFNTTKPTIFLMGAGAHAVTAQLNYTAPTTVTVASPSVTTTASTTTTGGTLSGSVFVDVTYVVAARINGAIGETAGSVELTVTMNAACVGTPTCTATINAPAAVTGAIGVNFYESNTTGTATKKLCNTAGPIDPGGTFQITANCAGAVMPTASTAYVGASAIIGMGRDATIFNLTNTSAFITCGNCSPTPFNWTFQDFSVVGVIGSVGQAKIVAFGGDNLTVRNVGFSGGNESIFWDGVKNSRIINTRHTELHDGNGYIFISATTYPCDHILIDSPLIRGGTSLANAGYTGIVGISNCDYVDIKTPQIDGVDCSRSASCGGVSFIGVHHGTLTGGTIQNLINADGVDLNGNSQTGAASRWTEDITVTGTQISGNTASGGIGTNHGNSDAVGILESRHIQISNVIGSNVGNSATAGQRLPCMEVYLSDSISMDNVLCHDSAQGVSTNSSTNLTFNNLRMRFNGRSGFYASQSFGTCTVSSASPNVVWATGQPFGPWPQGTTFILNATNKLVSSVTDFHNLVLTANAGITGTFNCGVNAIGKISNSSFDSNGQTAEAGNANRDGIALDQGSYFDLSNISANDLQTSKTQINGVETIASTTARATIIGLTGNGGSGVLLLDNVGASPWKRDDGAGEVWGDSSTKRVTTNVTNATTTMANVTGMSWNMAANKNYAIQCNIIYQAASTGGLKLAFTGPASPTQVEYCMIDAISAATFGTDGCTAAANTSFATVVGGSTVTSVSTNLPAFFFGTIENGANAGVLQLQFASAAAVNTIVERGTACSLRAVN